MYFCWSHCYGSFDATNLDICILRYSGYSGTPILCFLIQVEGNTQPNIGQMHSQLSRNFMRCEKEKIGIPG